VLPDGMETLRDGISCLCESWWINDLDGRDELVPQMLAYLLQRCLDPSSKVAVALAFHLYDILPHIIGEQCSVSKAILTNKVIFILRKHVN